MKYLALTAAFLLGCVLSFLGYRLARRVLLCDARNYPYVSMARVTVEVLYLVLLFFIGQKTDLDVIYLLIGGAVGMTVPTILFTVKLLKLTKENPADKEQSKENG